ncbi:universal stress protein [Acuticoccus sp. M5D2P5]|uniref:universal stress protein n=1 Tax=Acuticoccus kalidii TaxID=2910977 RepID=UPI001F328DCC|nr:universal stress protein [Acuticoccus kalidii]MCF3932174.1 universal stress protein [Acuticoccus kalidii]
MATKSIVCLVIGFEHEETAVEAAIKLAQTNAAELRLIHVSYPVYSYSGFFGEAIMVGGGWDGIVEKQAEARLKHAREMSERLCRKHGLPYNEAAPVIGEASGTFLVLENRTNGDLVREMSLCDLLVIGAQKGSSDVSDNSITGLALFSTGRPLLVVRPKPDGEPAWMGRKCALAWNDSPEAIRAVLSARDLMVNADEVHVLVATERNRPLDAHENTVVMDYLARHGVKAQIAAVARDGGSAAEAVLNEVRARGCDFMIMGAYGHSVFREMLVGGFTSYMMEEAEMPIVFAH